MHAICTPHPQAENLLFQNKRDLLTVFSDVIGTYELAHLSITCISQTNEVVFLSHTPSIEYNLITSGLWKYDLSYDPLFYKSNQSRLWGELYDLDKYPDLHHLKQTKNQFSFGFSIPIKRDGFYLIYSFATKVRHINPHLFFFDKQNELIKMGNYCFNKLKHIVFSAFFDESKRNINKPRRHLSLVSNLH